MYENCIINSILNTTLFQWSIESFGKFPLDIADNKNDWCGDSKTIKDDSQSLYQLVFGA